MPGLAIQVITAATTSHCNPSQKLGNGSPRRRILVSAKTLATMFLASGLFSFAQSDTENVNRAVPSPPQPISEQSQIGSPSYTFKVTTRVVIVEVVARDAEDNPVRDLTASDLRVSERIGDSKDLPEKIASFRAVNGPLPRNLEGTTGIVLGWLHRSFCGLAGAYELSYYLSPESRKDGLHRISVTSSRRGLRLFFRPGYKIEADRPAEVRAGEFANKQNNSERETQQALEAERKEHPELGLAVTACYDTLNITNFALGVQELDSKKGAVYQFLVPASYFAWLFSSGHKQPTQFDFSLCTFESGGHPLRHLEGTVQPGINPEGSGSLLSRGFSHTFTVKPGTWPEFSARLVVRDRNTGALGSGEILLLPLGEDQFPSPIPEGQTTSSFGTTTQITPLALCGDVYELAPWTTTLPRFSEIDATAPIYATSLGVYSRFFTVGIPGVTSRTEWFGVNYQGVFGIDRPGKYEFDLLSDDAAQVYIDDKLVVSDNSLHSVQDSRGMVRLDAGAHNLRVSYFQGPRTEVALVLLVKPPRRTWRLFDTKDFPNPVYPAAQRKKLPLLPE